MSAHMSVSLEPNGDGWYPLVCGCDQNLGVFPSAEDAADALADHAYAVGRQDGIQEAMERTRG